MKTVLIIGAGQLGSRHLQGLVKYLDLQKIYVLDPSMDSLKIAQEREKEIIHTHKVFYTYAWDTLPIYFDLVIIATNSNVRESVINRLLERHKTRFLILEKVLFHELDAYQRIHDLLVEHKVVTYVNHPRRMFESYKNIKSKIEKNKQTVYTVVGGNWGLGSNALHFLDLFIYLSGQKLKDVNVNSIHNLMLESTRKGFVEFTGTIDGHLSDDSFFSITSLRGDSSSISVTIFNSEQRFIVQEGGTPQVYELGKTNLFKCTNDIFKIQYQSELTATIALELFDNECCSLPTYEEARHTHEIFLKKMLDRYNEITGLQVTIIPIT